MQNDTNTLTEIFGEPLFTYTRKQALADGVQIDVTATAQEAGIRFPVYLTRAVFDAYVAVPPNVEGQDEAGRLWDVLHMLRFAIKRSNGGSAIAVTLFVRNNNRAPKLVNLRATCGPIDIDNAAPAITVMLPEED